MSHCQSPMFSWLHRCTIRCLTLDGCCPWALAQTVEATTITPTLLSVAVTALYPSTSTSQVRDTGKSEVAQRVDSLCPVSVSMFPRCVHQTRLPTNCRGTAVRPAAAPEKDQGQPLHAKEAPKVEQKQQPLLAASCVSVLFNAGFNHIKQHYYTGPLQA